MRFSLGKTFPNPSPKSRPLCSRTFLGPWPRSRGSPAGHWLPDCASWRRAMVPLYLALAWRETRGCLCWQGPAHTAAAAPRHDASSGQIWNLAACSDLAPPVSEMEKLRQSEVPLPPGQSVMAPPTQSFWPRPFCGSAHPAWPQDPPICVCPQALPACWGSACCCDTTALRPASRSVSHLACSPLPRLPRCLLRNSSTQLCQLWLPLLAPCTGGGTAGHQVCPGRGSPCYLLPEIPPRPFPLLVLMSLQVLMDPFAPTPSTL